MENITLSAGNQAVKTITIRRSDTGVSRHHGGPVAGPPETPRASQHYGIEGLKGSPIVPRGASLSDSRCKFFQSGQNIYIYMIQIIMRVLFIKFLVHQ